MKRIKVFDDQQESSVFQVKQNIWWRVINRLNQTNIKKILMAVIILIGIININYDNYDAIEVRQINKQSRPDVYITEEEAFGTEGQEGKNYRAQNSPNKQQQVALNKKPKQWQIQHVIWTYKALNSHQKPQQTSFQSANLLNTKHMAQLDNFKYIQINQINYTKFLSAKSQSIISSTLDSLQLQARSSSSNNQTVIKEIIDNLDAIKKRLIVYFVILENGGIFVDTTLTIVEKFTTWIQNVLQLPYINLGDKLYSQVTPQCFAFFHRDFSSVKHKLNVRRQFQFEKQMILFPSLEDYFLACNKQSQFLQQVINAYVEILLEKQLSTKFHKLNKNQNLIGKTNSSLIYQHGHLLAVHAVLQERQGQLNLKQTGQYDKLAIDDFGLVTINSYIAPRRLQHHYPSWNSKKLFIWMCKLTTNELEIAHGQIRFVVLIQKWITQMIGNQLIEPNSIQKYVIQNSFFHTFFLKNLPSSDQELNKVSGGLIERHPIVPFQINQTQNENNLEWSSYPKHLWVVWDIGMRRNSSFIVEICSQNLRKSAQNSGLQLHIVTQKNIQQYLSSQTLAKIDYAIKYATWSVTKQAISDIWRLALLMEHGGIYVDSTTFTINQNFDWIKNLTRMADHRIWNRYGQQPINFLFWNFQYSNHMVDLEYDKKHNTKKVWQLSYESNLIVAVKGSQLIKDWFDVFLNWLVSPYSTIESQMKYVNAHYERWTNQNYKYLLVMDAIKYVVGKKQLQIEQGLITGFESASDYYKLWSFPGQMSGQLKFRGESSFQDTDYRYNPKFQNNIYRFEFPLSYVSSIDGSIDYQAKFFTQGLGMNNMMMSFYQQNIKGFQIQMLYDIVHPQSLVGKILFYKYPDRTIYYLSYYNSIMFKKLQFKAHHTLVF